MRCAQPAWQAADERRTRAKGRSEYHTLTAPEAPRACSPGGAKAGKNSVEGDASRGELEHIGKLAQGGEDGERAVYISHGHEAGEEIGEQVAQYADGKGVGEGARELRGPPPRRVVGAAGRAVDEHGVRGDGERIGE